MSSKKTPISSTHHRTAPRTSAKRSGFAALALALLLTIVVPGQSASASTGTTIPGFDAELIRLVNVHRANLGLNPVVEYAPFSAAALNWSQTMGKAANTGGCAFSPAAFVHDTNQNIQTQGAPPNATPFSGYENIAWACGSGFLSGSWSRSDLPPMCPAKSTVTGDSPLATMCGWLDSRSGHREAIELPSQTHIGSGTAQFGLQIFSTHRFINAPVVAQTPTCNGLAVTVNMATGGLSTSGNDVILGTSGPDIIAGGAGNDTICGGGGNDTIWGQGGNDTIFGEAGDDKLRGGDDNDVLDGGDGVDNIAGGRGNDTIYGRAGADELLRGNTGDDNIWGGDGNDVLISGNGGRDNAYGEAGNDKVLGGPRPDVLYGGPGNDEIRGLGGGDTMYGDAGNDSLYGGAQGDTLSGGTGSDLCNGGWTAGGSEFDTADTSCETTAAIP